MSATTPIPATPAPSATPFSITNAAKLLPKTQGRVVVIGTSHADGTRAFAERIGSHLNQIRPNVIAIELDPWRYQALTDKFRGGPKEVPTPDKARQQIKITMMEHAFDLIGRYQEFVAGMNGTIAGGDMLVGAIGASVANLPCYLVDQQIDVTMKRVAKNLTWKDKLGFVGVGALFGMRVLAKLPFALIRGGLRYYFNREAFEKDIKNAKEKSAAQRQQLTHSMVSNDDAAKKIQAAAAKSNIWQTLVEERNLVLAFRTAMAAQAHPDATVALFVGAAHTAGVVACLNQMGLQASALDYTKKPSEPSATAAVATTATTDRPTPFETIKTSLIEMGTDVQTNPEETRRFLSFLKISAAKTAPWEENKRSDRVDRILGTLSRGGDLNVKSQGLDFACLSYQEQLMVIEQIVEHIITSHFDDNNWHGPATEGGQSEMGRKLWQKLLAKAIAVLPIDEEVIQSSEVWGNQLGVWDYENENTPYREMQRAAHQAECGVQDLIDVLKFYSSNPAYWSWLLTFMHRGELAPKLELPKS